MQQQNTHQSVERALRILMAFTPNNADRSVAELSKELGIHTSTVSRLLQVLANSGFVSQDPWTKKYSLGKSAFAIGNAIYQTVRERMVIIAQPYLDSLRDSIGQDVGLEVLVGNTTILAYRAWGPNQFRTRFTLGDRLPAHVVAGGKAILAYSPTDFVNGVLQGGLTSLTTKTVTDLEVVKKRLAEYRENGLAYDLGESDLDYHFVAAPVFNFAGRPVAAVVTGDLAEKVQGAFSAETLSALRETASKISARLMYNGELGSPRPEEHLECGEERRPGREAVAGRRKRGQHE